jgi:hypothetical protein
MLLNLANYFQIEAAAKGNVQFLLNLDFLLANEGIRRQEVTEQSQSEQSRKAFAESVETAFHQQLLGSGSEQDS